jgi:hypothetical protein
MTVDPTKPALSRRHLLRAGGGLAAAAAIGSAPFAMAAPARAEADDSPRFYVPGEGDRAIDRTTLHANWVMQSFGYDNVNQHIYFLQHNNDESVDVSHNGDLWVTKTDTAGNQLGAMALHNFGHGVSIGVEPYNGSVYLWTEWQVSSTSTFGTKVGRFKFVDGATLEKDDSSIQDRTPSIDETMVNPQPAIDPWADRLLVRYHVSTEVRIVGFTMDDARAGRVSTEYRKFERRVPDRTDGLAFQGYTALGRYAYLLYGNVSPTSFITTIDLNDSGQSVVDDFETAAGTTLPGREPQGMAIWLPSTGPRLTFGFHSNTDGVRQATVFYKNEFV